MGRSRGRGKNGSSSRSRDAGRGRDGGGGASDGGTSDERGSGGDPRSVRRGTEQRGGGSLRVGDCKADGYVHGLRRDDVKRGPWTCGCGAADNFAHRWQCRGCQRTAPRAWRDAQCNAARILEAGPGVRTKEQQGKRDKAKVGNAQGEELQRLRRELDQTKEELSRMRAPAGAAASQSPSSDEKPTDPSQDRGTDEFAAEVAAMEAAIACVESQPGAAAQASAESMRQALRDLRARQHAAWPPSRQLGRARAQAADANDKVQKRTAQKEQAQKVVDEAQVEVRRIDEQLAAAQETAARAASELDELLRRFPDDTGGDADGGHAADDGMPVGGGPATEALSVESLLQLLAAAPGGLEAARSMVQGGVAASADAEPARKTQRVSKQTEEEDGMRMG